MGMSDLIQELIVNLQVLQDVKSSWNEAQERIKTLVDRCDTRDRKIKALEKKVARFQKAPNLIDAEDEEALFLKGTTLEFSSRFGGGRQLIVTPRVGNPRVFSNLLEWKAANGPRTDAQQQEAPGGEVLY